MHLQPYDAARLKKFHRPATECWLFGGLLSGSIGGCLPTPFRSRHHRRGIEGNVEDASFAPALCCIGLGLNRYHGLPSASRVDT